jgi:hypothetical protein
MHSTLHRLDLCLHVKQCLFRVSTECGLMLRHCRISAGRLLIMCISSALGAVHVAATLACAVQLPHSLLLLFLA